MHDTIPFKTGFTQKRIYITVSRLPAAFHRFPPGERECLYEVSGPGISRNLASQGMLAVKINDTLGRGTRIDEIPTNNSNNTEIT